MFSLANKNQYVELIMLILIKFVNVDDFRYNFYYN